MHWNFRSCLFGGLFLLTSCGEAPLPAEPPETPSDPTFVGSDTCQGCHNAQFSDWQGSHHDLAMQIADETTVLGDFNQARFEYFDTKTLFRREGQKFVVDTQGATGDIASFEVAYTFGVTPLQQYLVEFPDGRLQALPFSWDSRDVADGGQRWYHLYPDEYIGPGDALHWTGRQQNWNYMCAECHSTDINVNYDLAQDSFDTTWSEIDVGCEACHGPASQHVDYAQLGTLTGDTGLLVDLDDRGPAIWQTNPVTGIAERSQLAMHAPQQPESCGRCHARRGVITANYDYGKPLTDTHRPSLLNPPLYFADGQIRDEVYVYGSFLQSRMYRAGVTCSDCHNPHSLQLITSDEPSGVCAQCHLPSRFASAEHHQHGADQVTCVDCHMPTRTYMGVDARRDHSMRVPRPDLSLVSDAPNACNDCHETQSAAWAAAFATERWGAPTERGDKELPGIVRATALTMLPSPLTQDDANAIASALREGDPLVRMAALQAARGLPPDSGLRLAMPLLNDKVRSVRIEAVSLLASLRDYLPASADTAFVAAAEEYRAAQIAIASRPEAHAALAQFEADMGNIDKAMQHSHQALKMEPNFALMRHSLGLLLVRSGRSDEALAELGEAVRLEPDVSRYIYVYAIALNSLGQSAEAIALLDGARRDFPNEFDIAWALATVLRDHGETARATEIARQMAERYPGNQNVIVLLESLSAD